MLSSWVAGAAFFEDASSWLANLTGVAGIANRVFFFLSTDIHPELFGGEEEGETIMGCDKEGRVSFALAGALKAVLDFLLEIIV